MSTVEIVQNVGETREVSARPSPTAIEIPDGGGDGRGPNTFHGTFDPETDSVPETIVSLVGVIKNAETVELEPLNDSVDTDAIEAVFARADDEGDIEVSFDYEGLRVTVRSDGNVWLRWK